MHAEVIFVKRPCLVEQILYIKINRNGHYLNFKIALIDMLVMEQTHRAVSFSDQMICGKFTPENIQWLVKKLVDGKLQLSCLSRFMSNKREKSFKLFKQ